MKTLSQGDLIDTITQSGILPNQDIKRIIGTYAISLAKQAAKNDKQKIEVDENVENTIAESLRIGTGIHESEAKTIIKRIEEKIKGLEDDVNFLNEGTFEYENGKLKFKYGK